MSARIVRDFPQFPEFMKWCQALQSIDRWTRKISLIEFEKQLIVGENELTKEDYHELFRSCHIIILNTLRDKSEPVREQSIKVLRTFLLRLLPLNDYYLSYLFPILVERIGTIEVIEESEEVRLQLVQFMHEILSTYKEPQLKPFVGDFIKILKQTVQDPYPAIKEHTCLCIMKLAQTVPQPFHMQAINLVKPVLSIFSHQRFKIRVQGVKCMGEIVMHSDCKTLEDCIGPMAERLFDQIPIVRQTIITVVARWMMEYRDRYSFFHKFLPLILTGVNDEVNKTRDEAQQLWVAVGLQYQKENEKDLKDQMDYLISPPKYYPPDLSRPNLGCRALVQRHLSKITPALARELISWQADVRVRCGQLLCVIALHAEEALTQHLNELLSGMYSAARDEDPRVVVNLVRACEIMACFIPVPTWLKLISPSIEGAPHYGHLKVVAAFIRCSPQEHVAPVLIDIIRVLSDPCISYSRRIRYQRELINCVQAIESKYMLDLPEELGQDLFDIIVTMVSIRDPQNPHINDNLLIDLQETLRLGTQYDLWHKFTRNVLLDIKDEPKSWSETTIERCVFETVLRKSREAFGEYLELIGEILVDALDKEVEPESRLKTFMALSSAFEIKDVIFQNVEVDLDKFLKSMITEVFVPSLVWEAGRTAEAMRTCAAACLASALAPALNVDIFKTQEFLRRVYTELSPLLISLAEDAAYRSRCLAMEIIVLLKGHLVKKRNWELDDLIKLYPEFMKRLDDPVDQVRVCSLKSLAVVLEHPPIEFHTSTYQGHHELLIDTLFTHFDDNEENFRNAVFDVLKVVAEINASFLKEKVDLHRPLVRNKKGCDQILHVCLMKML